MTNYRDALKELLAAVTYTTMRGEQSSANVYLEEEVTGGKARFKTPALIVRGEREVILPADIGWNYYAETYEIDVTLYLKLRSDMYNAFTVREDITSQITALSRQYKEGFTSEDIYVKLMEVTDRNYVEEVGILRRDFSFEVHKEV
ncbi:MAG: hypothetical protein H0Z33_16670 [Bacillaceae bacterium]|nr:hypothetical protein [Bacillaceae bacterium]